MSGVEKSIPNHPPRADIEKNKKKGKKNNRKIRQKAPLRRARYAWRADESKTMHVTISRHSVAVSCNRHRRTAISQFFYFSLLPSAASSFFFASSVAQTLSRAICQIRPFSHQHSDTRCPSSTPSTVRPHCWNEKWDKVEKNKGLKWKNRLSLSFQLFSIPLLLFFASLTIFGASSILPLMRHRSNMPNRAPASTTDRHIPIFLKLLCRKMFFPVLSLSHQAA